LGWVIGGWVLAKGRRRNDMTWDGNIRGSPGTLCTLFWRMVWGRLRRRFLAHTLGLLLTPDTRRGSAWLRSPSALFLGGLTTADQASLGTEKRNDGPNIFHLRHEMGLVLESARA